MQLIPDNTKMLILASGSATSSNYYLYSVYTNGNGN